MSFINQTTATQRDTQNFLQYANIVLPASTLQLYHNTYLGNRAQVLGLPMTRNDQQGQVIRNQAGQPQGFQSFSSLKLADRLALWGAGFGAAMIESGLNKAYIEAAVNRAVVKLGGVSTIDSTSEWSWLIAKGVNGSLLYFPDGINYILPGLVFTLGNTVVTITVDPSTGIGTVVFVATGSPNATDPL